MKTSFIRSIENAPSVNSGEDAYLKNKYDKFISFVFSGENTFSNKAAYYNTLVYTRTELSGLREAAKKNAINYLLKAIEIFDRKIEFVEKQILVEKIIECSPVKQSEAYQSKMKWTGSVVEWVEMIYALYLVKRINDGKISLKELFKQFGNIFDFEVKEFANYFMNIKNRKDGRRTKFTDLMRNSLLVRMEEADRTPSRK